MCTLKNFTVRMYKHEKYLSIPKEGSKITEIEDIGTVVDDLPDDSTTVSNVKILGALINSYTACVACNSKVMSSTDSGISKCTKCDLEQLTVSCSNQTSATLHIESGGQHFPLTAFTNILQIILQGQDITTINLLLAPPLTCTFDNNIITY